MAEHLKVVKSIASRRTRTTLDTILITPAIVEKWRAPPFQRPLRVNDKIQALAEELKEDKGVLPGVITLADMDGVRYLLDGQHRVEAFKLSGVAEGAADIRICKLDSVAEMGEEFVQLNSQLVKMRPDDILRGLEPSHPPMQSIRRRCPFVGFDQLRRTDRSPMVSMSQVLRCWFGAASEVPGPKGLSSGGYIASLSQDEADQLVGCLNLFHEAWGRDPAYWRLWSSLNMVLCAWLYRRTVLSAYSVKSARLTKDQFKRCLMALSADSTYLDWLVGRNVNDRDRSPGYGRVKDIFVRRLHQDTGQKPFLPAPPWHGARSR